jgi:hypothetical protein
MNVYTHMYMCLWRWSFMVLLLLKEIDLMKISYCYGTSISFFVNRIFKLWIIIFLFVVCFFILAFELVNFYSFPSMQCNFFFTYVLLLLFI